MSEFLEFKEVFEKWGSRYVIQSGEFKGYILETKVTMERISPMRDVKSNLVKDDQGLPRFNCSYNMSIRVLPPKGHSR